MISYHRLKKALTERRQSLVERLSHGKIQTLEDLYEVRGRIQELDWLDQEAAELSEEEKE